MTSLFSSSPAGGSVREGDTRCDSSSSLFIFLPLCVLPRSQTTTQLIYNKPVNTNTLLVYSASFRISLNSAARFQIPALPCIFIPFHFFTPESYMQKNRIGILLIKKANQSCFLTLFSFFAGEMDRMALLYPHHLTLSLSLFLRCSYRSTESFCSFSDEYNFPSFLLETGGNKESLCCAVENIIH